MTRNSIRVTVAFVLGFLTPAVCSGSPPCSVLLSHISMNIKCMHVLGDGSFVSPWRLILDVLVKITASFSFATSFLPSVKQLRAAVEQQQQYGNAVILHTMKFMGLKVFLGASGTGMGFDKSDREIVISLSQFVDGLGQQHTWHGRRCNLFSLAAAPLSQMVRPAAAQ